MDCVWLAYGKCHDVIWLGWWGKALVGATGRRAGLNAVGGELSSNTPAKRRINPQTLSLDTNQMIDNFTDDCIHVSRL